MSSTSPAVPGAQQTHGAATEDDKILPVVRYAFAPLHKLAFGAGTGAAGATFMALLTISWLTLPNARQFPLYLLGEFFAGYDQSWTGVLVGSCWGFVVGFVAGWFGAFCRNLALAITALIIRTRAELAETKGFLDHI